MKQIVKKLADFFGVTKEIQAQTRKDVGNELMQSSYYYGRKVGDTMYLYGLLIRQNKFIDDNYMRQTIDNLETSIHAENETNKSLLRILTT